MNQRRDYWTNLANFGAQWALLFALPASAYMAWKYGHDFIIYYTAAKLILMGQNPYEYAQSVQLATLIKGVCGDVRFLYPLWWEFPILPFATWPYDLARLAWLSANAFIWLIATMITTRLLNWKLPVWLGWFIWFGIYLSFGWPTLRVGQASILLFLDLAILLWALSQRRTTISAVTLTLLLTKPQTTWLLFLVLVIVAWNVDKRILIKAMLAGLVLFGLIYLVVPNWWDPILNGRLPLGVNQGFDCFEFDGRRLTTTLVDFLEIELNISGVSAILIWLGIGSIFLFMIWRYRNLSLWLMLAITFGFLLTPYAEQYDYALLTPVVLWVVHQIRRVVGWRRIVIVIGLVVVGNILIWENLSPQGLWFPIILAVLLVLCAPFVTRCDKKASSNSKLNWMWADPI